MVTAKKTMTPAQITEELRQIGAELRTEKLTEEGKHAILDELDKIEALLVDLKKQFSKKNAQEGSAAA